MGACRCGHPFGSGPCLSAHAQAKAAMAPATVPHVHQWLAPVRGVLYCAAPRCDKTARVDYP